MILVTGSTGNIGSELVGIQAASGEPVRALGRKPPASPAAGVEHAVGDLDDPASLAPALTPTTHHHSGVVGGVAMRSVKEPWKPMGMWWRRCATATGSASTSRASRMIKRERWASGS